MRHPELNGADSYQPTPDELDPNGYFDDRGDADFVCDGPCARTIYTGLLTRVDGRLLCQRCEPLPTFSWNKQGAPSGGNDG